MKELNVHKFIEENHGKDFREFSDSDTYALRDLKTAAKSGLLWKYMVSLGIPDKTKTKQNLYYYYNGRTKVLPNTSVFYCREKLRPAKWYYKIDEKLPPVINFTPKHTVKELPYLDSLGHLKLFEIIKQTTIPIFAEQYDFSVYVLKNVLYKRKHQTTGKMCFKILPQEDFIIKLRDVINPDLWYIFPDEV